MLGNTSRIPVFTVSRQAQSTVRSVSRSSMSQPRSLDSAQSVFFMFPLSIYDLHRTDADPGCIGTNPHTIRHVNSASKRGKGECVRALKFCSLDSRATAGPIVGTQLYTLWIGDSEQLIIIGVGRQVVHGPSLVRNPRRYEIPRSQKHRNYTI